jgi:hypothetical protein
MIAQDTWAPEHNWAALDRVTFGLAVAEVREKTIPS